MTTMILKPDIHFPKYQRIEAYIINILSYYIAMEINIYDKKTKHTRLTIESNSFARYVVSNRG